MKIRVTKAPRTGEQVDYGLVKTNTWSPSYSSSNEGVKNTIGGVPREEANIEAEGGETIIGDLNNDGNLEHFTITGKRHTQGGVPMNVPPGSFLFSDTKKMKIKDKDVLKHFGETYKAGGVTPAQIAKKYKLNEFMKLVNDPDTDPLAKRTAQTMLEKNTKKLAELALVQESMKGNPAPKFSEQILGSEQGEQEMSKGGYVLPKAQNGIQWDIRKIQNAPYGKPNITGTEGTAYLQSNMYPKKGNVAANSPYAGISVNPEIPKIKSEMMQLQTEMWNQFDKKGQISQATLDKFNSLNAQYNQWKSSQKPGSNTIESQIKPQLIETDVNIVPEVQTYQPASANKGVPKNASNTPAALPKKKVVNYQTMSDEELLQESLQELRNRQFGGEQAVEYRYNPTTKTMVPVLAHGGSLPTYQTAGEAKWVKDPQTGAMVREYYGPTGEKVFETKLGNTGKIKRVTGNKVEIEDAKGKVTAAANIDPNYGTYDEPQIRELESRGIKLSLPEVSIKDRASDTVPGMQGIRATGTYGTEDYNSPENRADFERRQPEFIKQNPNFDPKNELDNEKFQNWYNKDIYDKSINAGLTPAEAQANVDKFGFKAGSKDPNALDKKFGRYTWSRPTFNIEPKKPGETLVYRCPDCAGVSVPSDYQLKDGEFFDQAGCQTYCKDTPPGTPPKPPREEDWWLQNKVALASTAAQQPYFGAPAQFNVSAMTPNPQLEEYSAKNAMLQSNAAMAAAQINQSADPTVARANISSLMGKLNEQGAPIIENIQNRNVQTTNDFSKYNADIINRNQLANTELRKKYFDESNVYGQQLQNFYNTKAQRVANAFNRGVQGLQARNFMNAINPQYYSDPNTGQIMFDQSAGLSLDDNLFGMSGAAATFDPSAYATKANVYKQAFMKQGWSPDQAEKAAMDAVEKEQSRKLQSGSRMNPAMLGAYTGGTGFSQED